MAAGQKRKTYLTLVPGSIRRSSRVHRDDAKKARDRYADLITESSAVKKLVRQQIDSYGVSLYKICVANGLQYHRVKHWMNTINSKLIRGIVAQNDIMKLCEVLGVSVRLTLVVNKAHEVPDAVKLTGRRSFKYGSKNNVYNTVKEHDERQD